MSSYRCLPPAPPAHGRRSTRRALLRLLAAVLSGLLLLIGLPVQVSAAAEAPVPLGAAETYAVFGDSVTSTGATLLRGDLGILSAGGSLTGFPPGKVTGSTVLGDAAARAAIVAAFTNAAGRTPTDQLAGDQGGATLLPGVHAFSEAFGLNGILTLDAAGDPNAVFIFQINGALDTAAASIVRLVNGAQATQVFWQSTGAAGTGAGSSFVGTILSGGAITLGAGSTLTGRALNTVGAVTLAASHVNIPVPVVALTIDGGPAASATRTPHFFSGTASHANGSTVTVTVGGHTATATVQSDGSWSATSDLLPNGAYPVTASVAALGATAYAAQLLIVSAAPPVVMIDGGAAVTTGVRSPVVSGTSDTAPGSTVTVTVAGQDLAATVSERGGWTVTAAPLGDGPHQVVATARDPAGNPGIAGQLVTVQATAPAITIDGGQAATTAQRAPLLSGTTDAAPGTGVTVTVDGQVLTTTVQPDGAWRIRPAELAEGMHTVNASVANPAGVVGSAAQRLTVESRMPVTTGNGGAAVPTPGPTQPGSSPSSTGTSLSSTGTSLSSTGTSLSSTGTANAPAGGPVQEQVRPGPGSKGLPQKTAAVFAEAAPLVLPADAVPGVAVPVTTRQGLPATGFDLGLGWYGLAFLLLGGLLVAAGGLRAAAQESGWGHQAG